MYDLSDYVDTVNLSANMFRNITPKLFYERIFLKLSTFFNYY